MRKVGLLLFLVASGAIVAAIVRSNKGVSDAIGDAFDGGWSHDNFPGI